MAKTARKNSSTVGEPDPNNTSYYHRNAEARRQYQLRYNRVLRVTRRKVSKADLQALQERKHFEVHGMVPIYENQICCKSKEYDPERTQSMADAEEALMQELEQLKIAAKWEHQNELPVTQVVNWLPTYSRSIDGRLCNEIELGHEYAAEYKQNRSAQTKELLHATCRRAAILHQEVDLLQQGPEVYDTAVEYYDMVGGGRRVNKVEFRRLYGF